MSQNILIGAHVSAGGGIDQAPKRAKDIGCNVVQMFCSSPRVWSATPVAPDKIERYNLNVIKEDIQATVIHAQYLVNLASENPELLEKSRVSLRVDLNACAGIKARGVVVHLGSHKGSGWAAVQDQVAKEIAGILESTPDDAIFLIENAAGMNGKVGSDLREITWLIRTLKAGKRLGWCLDTCHAFAAGYSLVPMDGEKYLLDWINELELAEALKVIHVNDSRDEYFSHKDRHANLGEGQIPIESLKSFLTQPQMKMLPMVLEVPGPNKAGPERIDVDMLKLLFR
jgi:deoxyribonuclease-4